MPFLTKKTYTKHRRTKEHIFWENSGLPQKEISSDEDKYITATSTQAIGVIKPKPVKKSKAMIAYEYANKSDTSEVDQNEDNFSFLKSIGIMCGAFCS